jgi:hypothetical protein
VGRCVLVRAATAGWRVDRAPPGEVGVKADVPGADLREEAALGFSKVEVAATQDRCRPARRPCRDGSCGEAAAGVLLPAGLPSCINSSPVGLLRGRACG